MDLGNHFDSISIKSPLGGEHDYGSSPVDRSKLGTRGHIFRYKNGIPLSVVIAPASVHDIKAVTNVIDNSVIKQPFVSNKTKGIRHMEVSESMS